MLGDAEEEADVLTSLDLLCCCLATTLVVVHAREEEDNVGKGCDLEKTALAATPAAAALAESGELLVLAWLAAFTGLEAAPLTLIVTFVFIVVVAHRLPFSYLSRLPLFSFSSYNFFLN